MAERPHFFIVGAAKCGTTALFEYLSQHPSVFMPRMKEPQFFCTDLRTIGSIRTHEDYQELFASAPAGCKTGEATCWYLYSKIAIQRIMSQNPRAKIIVMLRDPIEAAHSLYAARKAYLHENTSDFEEAWRLQTVRLAGRDLPPGWPDPATLQYGPMYRYAPQVLRVLENVPARQRHIIIYEEFFSDPRRHYAETLGFLDLAPQPDVKLSVVNPAMGARSELIDRLIRRPPRVIAGLRSILRPLAHALGVHPARQLWKMNSVPQPKPPLRPAFRQELERYFAHDIAELERLLDRQLWRQAS